MLKSKNKSNPSVKAKALARKIYLDYASATPVDKSVLSVLHKELRENYSNSGAIHELAIKANSKIQESRENIARIISAHANEIIFTSGATESNNLAIKGIIEKYKTAKNFKNIPHIVTTNIEHSSVLETCKYLEKEKYAEVTYVPVEKNGIVDPRKIKKAIKENTVLVSVMYANNEIGTIQPIREIAKEIRHFKKIRTGNFLPIFHTDATQAVNYLPINVLKLGVDLMSFNGAKIYGPKGVGAIYVKRNIKVNKILFGGNQEFGLRPGTENVSGIAGFSKAIEITEKMKDEEGERLIKLRDYLINRLINSKNFKDYGIILNGDQKERLPNNVNITIPKIPSDLLVIEFSARGIYVSEKSACKSGDKKGSYVIEAIRNKQTRKDFQGSIRFSLGRGTKKEDLDRVLKSFLEILKKLKKWYN